MAAPLFTSGSASGWSRSSCGSSSVAIASVSRATCWVTSTSATARSRVALRIDRSERADQHDVAGGGAAVLPKHDRPGQQRDGQHHRDRGMSEPQLFEIAQAASARRQFPVDGRVEPVVLEAQPAKRPHQRHVVDDIDHLAVDGGGLVGEIVMQRLAGGGQAEHRDHHDAGDHDQARRHRQADGSDQRDRRNRGDARRQHVPDEHVFDREDRVRRRGDAAGQHSRQPVGKIARRMAGQVTEDVAAQIAGHSHKGEARGPAGDPPQEIVRGDQRHEENECQPYAARASRPGRQPVDQILHAILRAHRTGNRCDNRVKMTTWEARRWRR